MKKVNENVLLTNVCGQRSKAKRFHKLVVTASIFYACRIQWAQARVWSLETEINISDLRVRAVARSRGIANLIFT